jgi:hypothetical protein
MDASASFRRFVGSDRPDVIVFTTAQRYRKAPFSCLDKPLFLVSGKNFAANFPFPGIRSKSY